MGPTLTIKGLQGCFFPEAFQCKYLYTYSAKGKKKAWKHVVVLFQVIWFVDILFPSVNSVVIYPVSVCVLPDRDWEISFYFIFVNPFPLCHHKAQSVISSGCCRIRIWKQCNSLWTDNSLIFWPPHGWFINFLCQVSNLFLCRTERITHTQQCSSSRWQVYVRFGIVMNEVLWWNTCLNPFSPVRPITGPVCWSTSGVTSIVLLGNRREPSPARHTALIFTGSYNYTSYCLIIL